MIRRAAPAALLVLALAAGCSTSTEPPHPAVPPATAGAPAPSGARVPDPHEPDLGPAPTSTARSADPADVARRYLTASRGAGDGAAPRAAEAYMDPANPERGHGQQWEPPPPPGTIRQAERVELTETARSADRVVYRANYQLVERRGRRRTARTEQTASLVCARQPDGHWLVLRDAPLLHPAP